MTSMFSVLKSARRHVASLTAVSLISMSLLPSVSFALATAEDVGQVFVETLPSGQKVYVDPIHTQPIITIDTWVDTGSAQETPQINGVSHFLEHLIFKGTTHYKLGQIDKTLESRGAEFNAATSDDFTHFHITTATPYFKEALDLHADMLLNATINPPELSRERKVVQEEINRALDNPTRKAYMALDALLFENHPYAMDTLGPKSNVQNLPRETILGYYHKWYQPANFKTVVTGDVTPQEAVKLVNEAFSKAYSTQKRPPVGHPVQYPVAPLKQPRSNVLMDPDISDALIELGFQAPSVKNRKDNVALDIVANILGQGASSRLYQRLHEDQPLVNSINAANGTRQQAGVFSIDADVKPENRAAAKKAILEEIERFKAEGPTDEELQKAKNQTVKDFAFLTESTEGLAESIGYNITIGDLKDFTEYVQNIEKITPQEVRAAAVKYLDFNKAALVELVPKQEKDTLNAEIEDNIALLKSASSESVSATSRSENVKTASHVNKITLPSGATLLLEPSPAASVTAISIFAKGGRLTEPKPGLSSLMTSTLLKGTLNRSEAELSQDLESQGLTLGVTTDDDNFKISGASVSDDFPKLLLIVEDVLAHPAFAQAQIDKERNDILETLKTNRDEASNIMFEKLSLALFPNHPYGNVGSRVEASLPSITRDEILAYYKQSIQPKNLVIAVTGNFNADEVQSSLQQILSELPPSAIPPVNPANYPRVAPLKENEEIEAQKPEQAATWIAYSWIAPGISNSKDYAALKLINILLGSGLSSRLFVDLREHQGLAYHVSTQYPTTLTGSDFTMYIGTDPKNQEKVLEGFNTEVQRLLTEPLSSQELAQIKSKMIGLFALAHESHASQADYLGLYETLGVGYQFDHDYPALIQSVTSDDIQRVVHDVFTKPKIVVIVSPKVIRTDTPQAPHPHAD